MLLFIANYISFILLPWVILHAITQIAHLWWPNVAISGWHDIILAGGRNIGSPLAGVDVLPTLNHHWKHWLAQRHVIIIW